MAGKKLSAEKIERMEYLQSYVEYEIENIQRAYEGPYVDWDTLYSVLQEMRGNLPQSESE